MPIGPVTRWFLFALAFGLMAGCADRPPRQQDSVNYRSDAPLGKPATAGQHLTIQAGEGEKLNLPWFVRDAQNWVNSR